MQLRNWVILILVCAILPWLFVEVAYYSSLFQVETRFLGLLGEPPISELRRTLVLSTFAVFDALLVAIPLGALLAWFMPWKPVMLAALFMLGYSLAFLIWGVIDQAKFSEVFGVYTSFILWPHVVLLGLSLFTFRSIYVRRFQARA